MYVQTRGSDVGAIAAPERSFPVPGLSMESRGVETMGSLKVVHPLGKHFDIDLRYAVYFNRLGADLTYLRMVGSLGASWRW